MSEDNELRDWEAAIEHETVVREYLTRVASRLSKNGSEDALTRTDLGEISFWVTTSACLFTIVKLGTDYLRNRVNLDIVERRSELADKLRRRFNFSRKESLDLVREMLEDLKKQTDDSPLIQTLFKLSGRFAAHDDVPPTGE